MQRKSNLDLATVEDNKITFISNHSEGENEEQEEESDSEILNE
jgi:hypothetical protein